MERKSSIGQRCLALLCTLALLLGMLPHAAMTAFAAGPVTAVAVVPASITLTDKTPTQLTATVTPADATDASVSWTSGNEGIATVDQDGKVTAVANGDTTITAASKDGSEVKGACAVKVQLPLAVTGVTLDQATLALDTGASQVLTATVEPDSIADRSVTWSSSDTTVATVNEAGLVTGVKQGTATITAASNADPNKTASCTITVADVAVTGVTLNQIKLALDMSGTATATLAATVAPENATNKALIWASDKPAVAMVDASGIVTAVGNGTANITATADGSDKSATCAVTVTTGVTGVTVLPAALTMYVGDETEQLTATIAPDTASDTTLTWESDAEAVATVAEDGTVTAVDNGMANITATAIAADGSKKSAACAVTVHTKATAITLAPDSTTVTYGDTLALPAVTYEPATSDDEITWTTSDAAIVAVNVDDGGNTTLASTGAGTATITATAASGVSDTCTITVTPRPVRISAVTFTDKTYDGTTTVDEAAAMVTFTSDSVVGTDTVNISGTVYTTADKNVGANLPVTVDLTGAVLDNARYALDKTVQPATNPTVNVSPLSLEADTLKDADGKDPVYSGVNSLDGLTLTLTGFVGGDTAVTPTVTASAATKFAAGDNAVNVAYADGFAAANTNYTFPDAATLTVSKKPVHATVTAADKMYDATGTVPADALTAAITAADIAEDDVLTADAVEATANYDSKDAGTRTITGYTVTLGGTDAPNYSLPLANYNADCKGKITKNNKDVSLVVELEPDVEDPGHTLNINVAATGTLDQTGLTGIADVTYTLPDQTSHTEEKVAITDGTGTLQIDAVGGEQKVGVALTVADTETNYANALSPEGDKIPFTGEGTYNAGYKAQEIKVDTDLADSIIYGETPTWGLTAVDSKDKTVETGAKIIYTSSNASAATIDENGKITVVNVAAAGEDGKVVFGATAQRIEGVGEDQYNASAKLDKTVILARRAVTATITGQDKIYDGTAKAAVTYAAAAATATTGMANGDTLALTEPLTAAYEKADAGSYSVTATGLSLAAAATCTTTALLTDNYTLANPEQKATTTADVKITPYDLAREGKATVTLATDAKDGKTMYYTGGDREPVATVMVDLNGDGTMETTLAPDADYSVGYAANKALTTDTQKAAITVAAPVKGKNPQNYGNKIETKFEIVYAPIPENAITITGENGGAAVAPNVYPGAMGKTYWYNSDITVTPAKDYTVADSQPTTAEALSEKLVYGAEGLNCFAGKEFFVKQAGTGFIAKLSTVDNGKTDTYNIDKTAPVLTALAATPGNTYGDTVYYNSDFNVTFTVAEANYTRPTAADANNSFRVAEGVNRDGGLAAVVCSDENKDAITVDVKLDGKSIVREEYTAYLAITDPAGNKLVCTDPALQAQLNEDTAANGTATTKVKKVLDNVVPEVVITYNEPLDDACYYPGEAVYYNGAVTATYAYSDVGGLDEARLLAALDDPACKTAIGTATAKTETSKQITASADGRHLFYAAGKDMAGNELHITERQVDTKTGTTVKGAAGIFTGFTRVVDTKAPTAALALGTQSPNKALQNGRYYYNNGFTAAFSVVDANFDAKRMTAKTGHNSGATNYEADSLSADGVFMPNGAVYTSSSDSDGLYIYSIEGCDKAGNRLTLADKTNFEKLEEPFTSNVIALDTVAPIVDVVMDDFYAARLSLSNVYNVSQNNPYRKQSSATVTMKSSDFSPVNIEYSGNSTTAGDFGLKDGNFSYNLALSDTRDGQQIYTLNTLIVTDRAGNVSAMQAPTNKIYLDVAAPTNDELAPTISMTATANGDGRGPAGNDLFASSVTVNATVTDPGQDSTSSGLYHVYYRVLVNGADWTGSVGVSGAGSVETAGVVGYGTSGKDFANQDLNPKDEALISHDVISFNFDENTFNYNDIRILVWAEDNSGNKIEESQAAYYLFGIDITSPTIEVSYDNNDAQNEKYFKADRTATVVVTERNFDRNATVITTEGDASIGSWTYGAGGADNGDQDTWTCEVSYTVDGDYTFHVTSKDLLGHDGGEADYGASVAAREFTLDKTNPVIEIDFDNNSYQNGKYYKEDRTATINITEHNFSADGAKVVTTANVAEGGVAAPGAGGWGSAGDSNTATVNFNSDGDYTMTVDYTDLAGNEAEQETVDEFTVDTTAPELEISGVEDETAYNGDVAPIITYHDVNFDNTSAGVSITGYKHSEGENLNGTRAEDAFGGSFTCDNIAPVKENDDIYTATGSVMDLAGNTTEATIRFSVNRFGSTYMLTDATQVLLEKYYTNSPESVGVTEINVSPVATRQITISLDGDMANLNEGTDYSVAASAPGWQEYDYTINAANFDKEGLYDISLYSEDEAGNASSNRAMKENDAATSELPINFVVDKTPPTVNVTGVDNAARYNDVERTIMVNYSDNVTVTGLTLYLNDVEIARYDADQLKESGGTLQYIAKADDNWQTFRVSTVDEAGNTYAMDGVHYLLTDNLFIQYINNKPLLYGSGAGVVIVGGLIGFLLARRRKTQGTAAK